MRKWSKDARSKQRYRCRDCGVTSTIKQPRIIRQNRYALYLEWLSGKQSLDEVAQRYKVTRRTLDNWFKPFRQEEILPDEVRCSDQVVLADGYYLNRYACILIVILTTNQPVTWSFTHTESTSTWFTCFNQVRDTPLAIVLDGKAGCIKAARNRWPRIIVQRCQFQGNVKNRGGF